MKAVSVILPVYNVEKYLGECLDSLLNQTLKDIEVICVDDGSTDNSVAVIEQRMAKDDRVRLFRQENLNAGVARNVGMKHATGKYLLFLDADDFFDETLIEKVYTEAENTQAQVVLFGGKIYDEQTDEFKEAPWFFKRKVLPKEVPFAANETNGKLLSAFSPATWTKFFKREYVESLGLQFMDLKNSNDVFFTFIATSCAERISCVDETLVFYRKGIENNLQTTKKNAPLCFLDAYYAAYEELHARNIYEDVKNGFKDTVISGCLYNYDTVDAETKKVITDAFWSEKFMKMDLLDVDDNSVDIARRDRLKKIARDTKREEIYQGKEPKVSVIIPVYNVEAYIEECLLSVLNQTLKEVEVVCVNDGTPDNSMEIVKRYEKDDPRIVIVNKENGGLSSARNAGLCVATGTYVYFLDSDDYILENALERLYEEAETHELDSILFDADSFFESEELKIKHKSYITYYHRDNACKDVLWGQTFFKEMVNGKNWRPSACLQMNRRSMLLKNEIFFKEGIIHEDNGFSLHVSLYAQKMKHIPERFYQRRVREDSIMTNKNAFRSARGYLACIMDSIPRVSERVTRKDHLDAYLADLERMKTAAIRTVSGLSEKDFRELQIEDVQEKIMFDLLIKSNIDLFNDRTKVAVKLMDKEKELKKIKNSRSYKLGRKLTEIPRKLKSIFKRKK